MYLFTKIVPVSACTLRDRAQGVELRGQHCGLLRSLEPRASLLRFGVVVGAFFVPPPTTVGEYDTSGSWKASSDCLVFFSWPRRVSGNRHKGSVLTTLGVVHLLCYA